MLDDQQSNYIDDLLGVDQYRFNRLSAVSTSLSMWKQVGPTYCVAVKISLYTGNSMAKRGHTLRGLHSQLPLDMPLRTQSQCKCLCIHGQYRFNEVIRSPTFLCASFTVSSLDCVPLTDTVNQAKQYSYHLRPHSAGQGTRGREKH